MSSCSTEWYLAEVFGDDLSFISFHSPNPTSLDFNNNSCGQSYDQGIDSIEEDIGCEQEHRSSYDYSSQGMVKIKEEDNTNSVSCSELSKGIHFS